MAADTHIPGARRLDNRSNSESSDVILKIGSLSLTDDVPTETPKSPVQRRHLVHHTTVPMPSLGIFANLPLEIRQIIWDCFLPRSKHDSPYNKHETLSLSILRASKTIHSEVFGVMFFYNFFYINFNRDVCRFNYAAPDIRHMDWFTLSNTKGFEMLVGGEHRITRSMGFPLRAIEILPIILYPPRQCMHDPHGVAQTIRLWKKVDDLVIWLNRSTILNDLLLVFKDIEEASWENNEYVAITCIAPFLRLPQARSLRASFLDHGDIIARNLSRLEWNRLEVPIYGLKKRFQSQPGMDVSTLSYWYAEHVNNRLHVYMEQLLDDAYGAEVDALRHYRLRTWYEDGPDRESWYKKKLEEIIFRHDSINSPYREQAIRAYRLRYQSLWLYNPLSAWRKRRRANPHEFFTDPMLNTDQWDCFAWTNPTLGPQYIPGVSDPNHTSLLLTAWRNGTSWEDGSLFFRRSRNSAGFWTLDVPASTCPTCGPGCPIVQSSPLPTFKEYIGWIDMPGLRGRFRPREEGTMGDMMA